MNNEIDFLTEPNYICPPTTHAEITDKEIVGPEQVVGPESNNLETSAENSQIDHNLKKLTILSVVKSNRGNLRIGNINFSKI